MITGIKRVNIEVSDLVGALQFFAGALNIPILREVALKGHPHSWDLGFSVGGPLLSIAEQMPGQPEPPGTVTIVLETDDIAADYEAMKAQGVPFTGPPTDQDWEGTVSHFKGPNGVLLSLVQSKRRE
ncbi:MAG: VOC family protein [Bacteroidetes bacterium]|nr:VOC family protein [Bacteroidota bacterium]